MKGKDTKTRCLALGAGVAALASALLWPAPSPASDYALSGESTTIFRMRTTIDDKNLFPAYEYLRLNLTDNRNDGYGLSFHVGAWGRADLGDESRSDGAEGALQYAFLAYHAPKNNAVAVLGRQFVNEGVAAERIDGLYLRSDFAYGIGASAFLGAAVLTEPTYQGGNLVYGARLSQTDRKLYAIGLSALKSEQGSSRYREEEGIDLWLRPHPQLDLTGRSTYNSITDGWMEHSYAASYSPLSTLQLGADFSRINFKDYLYGMTTSALSILNPAWSGNQRQTAVGVSAAYGPIGPLTLAADCKFYSYTQSGDAAFFGGKATYALPESFTVGASLHRMEGDADKLRYLEVRAFASLRMGPADLTVDAIDVNYDKEINGVGNSYAITGAAGYQINRKLKVGADLTYSRNPYFDSEVSALAKATYAFDTNFAAEGGTKSEK